MKSIIFDCDGTLFNTEQISVDAFNIIADKYNIELPNDFFLRIMGGTFKANMEYFENEVPEMAIKYDEVREVWQKLTKERSLIKDYLNKKGLIKLLDYLSENKIKMAIASSSPVSHIERLVNSISKEYHFDVIVSGTEVKHSKPAPDIFLLAAEKMDVKASDCIIVEDSKNGVIAGKRANATVIYIKDIIDLDDEIKKEYVDFELNSLDEIIDIFKERQD